MTKRANLRPKTRSKENNFPIDKQLALTIQEPKISTNEALYNTAMKYDHATKWK